MRISEQVTPEWMGAAACADRALGSSRVRARVFYPAASNSTSPASSSPVVWLTAKRVCATCPVRTECLDHAITHRETDGVWGGLDRLERQREARRRRDRARRVRVAS